MTTPKPVFERCARSDRLLIRALGGTLQRSVATMVGALAVLCFVVAAVL